MVPGNRITQSLKQARLPFDDLPPWPAKTPTRPILSCFLQNKPAPPRSQTLLFVALILFAVSPSRPQPQQGRLWYLKTEFRALFIDEDERARVAQAFNSATLVHLTERNEGTKRARPRPCNTLSTVFGEWLSLVEHLVRDQGVGGSNPLSPTIFRINRLQQISRC